MAQVNRPFELETNLGILKFNEFAAGNYLHLDEVAGLNAQVRTSIRNRPQHGGARPGPGYKGGIYPVLDGRIIFDSIESRAELESQFLMHAYAIISDPGVLRYQAHDGSWRQLEVTLNADPQVAGQLVKTFQLPLKSGWDTLQSTVLHEEDSEFVLNPSGDGGLVLPFTVPTFFGYLQSGGDAVIDNAGDGSADAYPVIRIHGTLTDPAMLNETTGGMVILNGENAGEGPLTIEAPDFIEIDMWQETITLNGDKTQSLLRYLDQIHSIFWPLQPGPNNVRVIGTSPDPATAHATMYWRDSYVS